MVFQYDYKGVTYIWNFEDMEHNDYSSYTYVFSLQAGKTRKDAIYIENYSSSSLESIDISAGTTRLAFVYSRKDYTSYDKYVQGYKDITVYIADSEVWTPASVDLTPSFTVNLGSWPVIEGISVNNNKNPSSTVEVILSSEPNIPGVFPLSRDITSIEWTSSGGIITSGSSDVPAKKTQSYRPYIKFNRDGLNALTLEYYFVDSNDNKIDTPESVSDVNVNIWGYFNFSNVDTSGTITLNFPEIYLTIIDLSFKDDGITYHSGFFPVNRPDGDISSSDIISWDIGYSDLSLIMYVGDSLDIALTAPNISDPVPYVGSTAIVSMDVLSSADHTVTVRLTAKAAGMTSINLASAKDSYGMTLPREIWVADSEGKVPHLTRDGTIDDIIEQLTSKDIISGKSGGWYENTGSSSAARRGIRSTAKICPIQNK